MLLVTFSVDGSASKPGALVEGGVRDLSAHVPDLRSLVEGGAAALAALRDADGAVLPRDAVRLHAPLRPGKIVGVGLNYVEHVDESHRTLDTAKELPTRPVLFGKPATAVVGPEEPILHDGNLTAQLDWECELAVVIGRTTRRVSREDALQYVFGYSIVNDISARDQRRSGQWFFSKGQDSYAPFGPAIRTADEVPDPQALDLGLRVNGEVKQKGNTAHMLFPVAELIADISSGMTLEPGDVIATGSPQGVGAAQNPPQFLRPGDVVEARIEGIGTLRNPVVDVRGDA
ncbi:fumarylacetoacetate hydrolase family protein [Pseudonocardia asaccharolytica]|uniref:Gentisate 1,2-dioxygenase n=1 Tax=Pseudonocardia asaccharolytica DSM 44247 = NBRC 16224 TaxID=1123024 RepID=A0A511CW49_9PSEU|nr:fumarylacetoacetate hydrolase family protein [Pseudonocardia asaccharolytica]GEL16771.1 gentisate 1,2-dioxygenase [Pseudonocardia asaccharolytica DSM 44247 = NBRC 16224]